MVDATTIDASDPIIIEFQSSLGNVFGDISSPFGSSEPIFGRRLSWVDLKRGFKGNPLDQGNFFVWTGGPTIGKFPGISLVKKIEHTING